MLSALDSDPLIKIIEEISKGNNYVSIIAKNTNKSLSTCHEQLNELVKAGLIESKRDEKEWRKVIYTINWKTLTNLIVKKVNNFNAIAKELFKQELIQKEDQQKLAADEVIQDYLSKLSEKCNNIQELTDEMAGTILLILSVAKPNQKGLISHFWNNYQNLIQRYRDVIHM